MYIVVTRLTREILFFSNYILSLCLTFLQVPPLNTVKLIYFIANVLHLVIDTMNYHVDDRQL